MAERKPCKMEVPWSHWNFVYPANAGQFLKVTTSTWLQNSYFS